MVKAFKYSILSSGSDGNAIYLESDQEKLLIDAGLSGKKIENLLLSINKKASDLTGILVTHEHRDHIIGVGVLARRYHIPVYANRLTWAAMESKIKEIPSNLKCEFPLGVVKRIGDLEIESFGVSHDAVMPQFYKISRNGYEFVILTDTGYCSDKLLKKLANANAYIIEMNHDVEILKVGTKYSWELKQRIMSDVGHLSNEDGAFAAVELYGPKTKHLYLGHLSKENNLKPLAREVMEQTLKEAGIKPGIDIEIHDTFVERATSLTEIEK